MLVTFTDSSKTTVSQIEQFPDLNTLQPLIDWRNSMVTVLVLFAFALLAQLITAFGFPGICVYVLWKRQPLTIFHLIGLSLAIVCWMSMGFFISLGVTPYPVLLQFTHWPSLCQPLFFYGLCSCSLVG
jgi:hypothetical protein